MKGCVVADATDASVVEDGMEVGMDEGKSA